jgi:hypothetical protein
VKRILNARADFPNLVQYVVLGWTKLRAPGNHARNTYAIMRQVKYILILYRLFACILIH